MKNQEDTKLSETKKESVTKDFKKLVLDSKQQFKYIHKPHPNRFILSTKFLLHK